MAGTLSWLFLMMSMFLNAAASLLLKLAATWQGPTRTLPMGGSVVCYGLAFLCYFTSLRRLPVSIAYPIVTGGGVLLIVLIAAACFNEPLTGHKALGAGLVVVGGVLLLWRP